MKKVDRKIENLESYILILKNELIKRYSMNTDKK